MPRTSKNMVSVNPAVDSVILEMDAGAHRAYIMQHICKRFGNDPLQHILMTNPDGSVDPEFYPTTPPALVSEGSFPWPNDSAIFSVASIRGQTSLGTMVLVIKADEGKSIERVSNDENTNVAVEVMQKFGWDGYSPGEEVDFKGSWSEYWCRFHTV